MLALVGVVLYRFGSGHLTFLCKVEGTYVVYVHAIGFNYQIIVCFYIIT